MTDLTAAPFFLDAEGLQWVEQTLAGMSARERVGQLMCIYLRGTDMAEWTAWLDEHGIRPGGMMMISRPVEDARRDVTTLQEWSRVPLLMAGNLEAGASNFLTGPEAFAHPMQLAATRDVSTVEQLAEHCARIADHVGINWAFAPVIDIAMNADNPITNTRTFGSDPDLVAEFGAAYIAALEGRRIATSAKHFPGDGVDGRDQHLVTTSNDLDAATWRTTFGAVYERAIAAGARTIMAGHIRQPALDSERLPATLSPALLGLLRDELGFEGMIVSDNSAMTGLTSLLPRREGLVGMLAAGIDMVLGNLDVVEDFELLLDAVESGEIAASRIEDAVRRILAVKASIGLHRGAPRTGVPNTAEELAWRDEIAARSVTLVKDTQSLLPLSADRHPRCLVYVIGDEPTFYDPAPPLHPRFVAGLKARGLTVEVRAVPGNSTTPADAEHLHEHFDVCIYFSALRFIGNSNTLRVHWSPWQGWDAPRHVATLPTALVSVADPYQLRDLPMIRTAINGYTPTTSVVDAALAVLFGEAPALGASPVDPFVGHWDAAL